jgi:hypothetical protein
MMRTPLICLVTIHGIGFQQPPEPALGLSGYADGLHQHLSKYLPAPLLGDDPGRTRLQYGENGPIYVQSHWPPHSDNVEQGLARLGRWSAPDMRTVDTTAAPLADDDARIAHVALVYSPPEHEKAQIGAALLAGSMSLAHASHYAHIKELMHMVLHDSLAIIGHPETGNASVRTSLMPRHDLLPKTLHLPHTNGLLAVLHNLENDVAAYVSHNEQREHIRSFVHKALLRLAAREDVAAIVINAHSNGTVIALDVLRQLPPFVALKIKAFITAGSPLRKYVAFFYWGQQIESAIPIPPWFNFWDKHDPVADPLAPPLSWHRGDPILSSSAPTLFQHVDPNTGAVSNILITDVQVDNLAHSYGGSLQAHNYWDNEEEFVKPLAKLLRQLAETYCP